MSFYLKFRVFSLMEINNGRGLITLRFWEDILSVSRYNLESYSKRCQIPSNQWNSINTSSQSNLAKKGEKNVVGTFSNISFELEILVGAPHAFIPIDMERMSAKNFSLDSYCRLYIEVYFQKWSKWGTSKYCPILTN